MGRSQVVSRLRSRDGEGIVVKRCLALLGRLLRGPATKAELVRAVREAVGEDVYGSNPEKGRNRAFERDRNVHLPKYLGVVMRFDRRSGRYALADFSSLPGFDLPEEALTALAFLEDTFQPGAPHHEDVLLLLDRLSAYLPEARRRDLARQQVALGIEWRQFDRSPISPIVEAAVERAKTGRRLLRFLYRSPSQADGIPRRHTVEPYERYFDPLRGHHYLYAFCRETDGPKGGWRAWRYWRYRISRILPEEIEVLPDRLPPVRPRQKRYSLLYRLSPAIARLGDVSERFDNVRVTMQEDGSAIVQAETDDLFFAVRTLLHYGPNCEVLGGPEVQREMQQAVKEMAKLYENS